MKKLKIFKLPKCPKSVTGKHLFVVMNNGGLWEDFQEWIECTRCGIVDDRKNK